MGHDARKEWVGQAGEAGEPYERGAGKRVELSFILLQPGRYLRAEQAERCVFAHTLIGASTRTTVLTLPQGFALEMA